MKINLSQCRRLNNWRYSFLTVLLTLARHGPKPHSTSTGRVNYNPYTNPYNIQRPSNHPFFSISVSIVTLVPNDPKYKHVYIYICTHMYIDSYSVYIYIYVSLDIPIFKGGRVDQACLAHVEAARGSPREEGGQGFGSRKGLGLMS